MTKNNERIQPLNRGRLDRITQTVERYTKFGNLLIDGALGSSIVLAVLVIALVFYQAGTVTQVQNASSLESDYHTLLTVRDTLAGSAELNWSKSVPIELWDGVLVGGNPRRVIWLKLAESRLTGTISAQLGSLDGLTHLNLKGNQLSGKIPAELGDLSSLQLLWLSNNGLSGPIPSELGRLSNLFELNLRGNQLSGSIPAELSQLTNLTRLFLHDNRLSGTIPVELGDLANLQRLWLSNNQLTGSIPMELGNLRNLVIWRLGPNLLTGCVPNGLVAAEDNDFDRLALEVCEDS